MRGVPFTLVDIRILNIFYFLIDNDAVRVFLCFIFGGVEELGLCSNGLA
jgi:hypothetical protein